MRKERIYTNTNPKNFTDAIDEKIDRENMLRQLLQELPVQQKRVLLLRLSGWTDKEIQEEYDIVNPSYYLYIVKKKGKKLAEDTGYIENNLDKK